MLNGVMIIERSGRGEFIFIYGFVGKDGSSCSVWNNIINTVVVGR